MPGRATAQNANAILAPDTQVQRLAGGFQFTEGPACDDSGNVFFSDIPNCRIHKWSDEGQLTTFRENSGRANGLFFDGQNNLVACEGGSRRLTSIAPDGKVTVLAEAFDGKKLNSPNDLWIHPNGGIYFTDPRYGKQDGIEQDGFHVYYLGPDRDALVRVIDDLQRPNGVVGTADGKVLYVTDEKGNKTYVYQIGPDGALKDRKLFVEKGSDGMTLDEKGNVYLTNKSVWVYGPDGTQVAEIPLPESAANVCFGGTERSTLFITARTGFYAVPMLVRGQ
jgi:gluconolactonase